MANRIVLNTVSYHGKGTIGNIVPELVARGFQKAFVCSDPDLIRFNVTKKVTDLLDAAGFAYEAVSYTHLEVYKRQVLQKAMDDGTVESLTDKHLKICAEG